MKAAIVSGADASMFDLLEGLIRSVQACPQSSDLDLCILDVGLSAEQRAQLAPLVTRIVPAEWDFEFPARATCPSWYKVMFSRPFFPRYFPEYDVLLWIDADAWLCNWEAMKLLLYAAWTEGFAIVPELDRTYGLCFRNRPDVLENLRATYLQGFGAEAAERFAPMPVLNCGVFAMRRDAPYWRTWSEILIEATQKCARPLVEQCALNLAVYSHLIPAHFLPSWCNWNCAQSVPILDPTTRRLSAPLLPYEPISICHLVDLKRQPIEVRCTDRTTRIMPLTYESVRVAPLPPPV